MLKPMQKPRRRVQTRSIETHESLITAAIETFAEHGYRGATLSEIAHRAGVTVGAIYSHFSSKDQLLFDAARKCLEDLRCPPDLSLSPPEMAANSIRNFMAPGYSTARRLIIELYLAASSSPELATLSRGFLEHLTKQWTSAIPQCNDDPAAVEALLIFLMGLTHLDGFSGLTASGPEFDAAVIRMMTGLFPSSDELDS